jgi:hypothetical protein
VLVQAALGGDDRIATVERWLVDDVEVIAMLRRVRAVVRELESASLRAKELRRRALELALAAPARVRIAARAVWAAGPQTDRDERLRRLEALPLAIKQRADELRDAAMRLPVLAAAARGRIADGLRGRGPTRSLARTDRLTAV